ncbi:MAG: DNA repair protein RecO [Planctomycetota bacterium]
MRSCLDSPHPPFGPGTNVPQIRDVAICIRHWDFSETSQTVSLLTREHGILRGLAKGSRREKGDFSGGIDLLTCGQVMAIVKPSGAMATLTQWHLHEMFPALRSNLSANRAGWYLADLVHHMLTDQDPHPHVHDALIEALRGLDADHGPAPAVLRFQWRLLCECGYQPEVDVDAETRAAIDESASTLAFSPTAGGVVTDTGDQDRWRVRSETVDLLRLLAADQPIAAQDETVRRATRLLATYIRQIIGVEPGGMRFWLEE